MKLIITRHGETLDNIKMVCQGQTDGQLSEKGIEQAEKLGVRFKDDKIDEIYSSDLKRTIDTANEIIKYHSEIKLNTDKRIRERFFGEMQGSPFPEGFDWENLPDYVETNEEMKKRAKEFIDEIYLNNKNKTVLVVCHFGMKKILMEVINNISDLDPEVMKGLKNTAVSEFKIEENGDHKMHIVNCIKHLE